MGRDEIRQKIEDSKADVFGISSSFTSYHGEALEIARIIKESGRMKTVVMGGSHVSCDPEGVLKSPDVDYVVLGEGEIRFPLLLERIKKNGAEGIEGIDGIGYRKDGEIRINPLQKLHRRPGSPSSSRKGSLCPGSIQDEEKTVDHVDHQQRMSPPLCLLFRAPRHGKPFPDAIAGGHCQRDERLPGTTGPPGL